MSRISDNLRMGLCLSHRAVSTGRWAFTGQWAWKRLSAAVGHYGIRVFSGAGLVVGGGLAGRMSQMSRLANDLRDKEKLAPMAAAEHVKAAAMKPHTGPAAGKQDSGG